MTVICTEILYILNKMTSQCCKLKKINFHAHFTSYFLLMRLSVWSPQHFKIPQDFKNNLYIKCYISKFPYSSATYLHRDL